MELNELGNILNNTEQAPEGRDDSALLQFTDELDEEKVLKKCQGYESDWKNYASEYEKDLQNSLSAYIDQQVTMQGVSVKVPEIFTLIETEAPHLINSLFAQSEVVELKPKFIDPDNMRTFKIKGYLNNLIKEICDGEKKTISIIKNELIYGTSFVKVLWEKNFDIDFNPLNGEQIKINSSHSNFYLVDPWSIAFDRYNETNDLANCEWFRERVFISKDKMRVMRDNGLCAWFDDEDMTETENKGRYSRQKKPLSSSDVSEMTYYDEYSATLTYKNEETGGYESDEFIIWVLSENKVIKFHKNQQHKKMYCMSRAYETPNEFLGKGEPHIIGAISSHLSYVHSQLGKTIKRVGETGILITPDAGMSAEGMRLIEDGVYMVDDLNSIKPMETMDSQNVEVLINATKYLGTLVEDITGIGPALAGTQDFGDVTATAASLVFQSASNRLALKLFSLQEDFVKKLAEKLFLLTKQTIRDSISFFDTNNNNITLTPKDFEGNYTFIANGSILQANSALKMAANSELIQSMIQLVGASQASSKPLDFNGDVMLQKLISPYAGIPDFSQMVFPKVMPPAPPPNGQIPPPPAGKMHDIGKMQVPLHQSALDPSGVGLPMQKSSNNPQSVNRPRMKFIGNKEGNVNTINSGR